MVFSLSYFYYAHYFRKNVRKKLNFRFKMYSFKNNVGLLNFDSNICKMFHNFFCDAVSATFGFNLKLYHLQNTVNKNKKVYPEELFSFWPIKSCEDLRWCVLKGQGPAKNEVEKKYIRLDPERGVCLARNQTEGLAVVRQVPSSLLSGLGSAKLDSDEIPNMKEVQ